jgi:hypothetical protein
VKIRRLKNGMAVLDSNHLELGRAIIECDVANGAPARMAEIRDRRGKSDLLTECRRFGLRGDGGLTLTCLRKDPQKRYASAKAFGDDLERWLDGLPIRARPVSTLERAGRWCRRRPAMAALIGVLALTVASSLVGLLTLWRRSEAQRVRAVASAENASEAVRQVVDLLTSTVDTTQMLSEERIERSLRFARDLTARMRQDEEYGDPIIVAFCDLENQLSKDFRRRGRMAESRSLLTDLLESLDARQRRRSEGPVIKEARARVLQELGDVNRNEQRFDEAIIYFRRSANLLDGLARDSRQLSVIVVLDAVRQEIAGLLGRRGQDEERRSLLEDHVRLLEH